MNARKTTTRILELMDEGILNPRDVAARALDYMSEADVRLLVEAEGLIYDEEADEDDAIEQEAQS